MAIISNTTPVSDSQSGTWQIVGSVETETGVVTFKIYDATGDILTEGSPSHVLGLLNKLPPGTENFVGKVISTVNSMNASLKQSVPTPATNTVPAPEAVTEPLEIDIIGGYTEPMEIDIIGGNETTAAEPSQAAPSPTISRTPLPNVLHQYPSYTYGISLHLMTPAEYNTVVEKQTYKPKNVLIASAGRNDPSSFPRNQFFNEDFYFEGLDMTTIVGLNATSRATNAINLKFKIIEPYGLTLINRILDACSALKIENYTAAPYVLQIDFYAINDAGELTGILPDHSKFIPLQLLTLGIRATGAGSEYDVEAVPFNHNAFNVTTLTSPSTFEIVGGDVASIFQSNEKETFLVDAANQLEQEREQDIKKAQTGTYQAPDGTLTYAPSFQFSKRVLELTSNSKFRVKSFGSAMNTWHESLKKDNEVAVEDRYYFKFDKQIGTAKFNFISNAARRTAMGEAGGTLDSRRGDAGINIANFDVSQSIFTINAGTSIDALLNYVIRNSDYIQKQLTVTNDHVTMEAFIKAREEHKNLPLKWFKIIPVITLREYDPVRKRFARDITYNVIPYEVWNAKISAAPQGQITVPVKKYDYIYTGKNSDILEFNIEFNSLYYTSITAYKSKMESINNVPEKINDANPANYANKEYHKFNAVQQMPELPQHTSSNAPSDEITSKSQAAVDVQQSVYTESGADMLAVNLKIIGDPMFIKQDDIFYSPKFNSDGALGVEAPGIDPRLTANGSLIMDNKEVYIQINFRTPVDIDEQNGMMKFDDNYVESLFSGMYRVLKVDSSFRGGQFTQALEAVRLPRQLEYDYSKLMLDNENRVVETNGGSVEDTADSLTSGPSAETSAASEDADTAPGNNPVDPTAPATQDDQGQKIAKDIENAPTETMTATTAPPLVPPPPPPKPPLPEGVTQNQSSGNYEYGGKTLPLSDTSDPKNLSKLVNAMAAGDSVTIYETDTVSGRTKSIKYDSSTGNFTSRLE